MWIYHVLNLHIQSSYYDQANSKKKWCNKQMNINIQNEAYLVMQVITNVFIIAIAAVMFQSGPQV